MSPVLRGRCPARRSRATWSSLRRVVRESCQPRRRTASAESVDGVGPQLQQRQTAAAVPTVADTHHTERSSIHPRRPRKCLSFGQRTIRTRVCSLCHRHGHRASSTAGDVKHHAERRAFAAACGIEAARSTRPTVGEIPHLGIGSAAFKTDDSKHLPAERPATGIGIRMTGITDGNRRSGSANATDQV